LDREVDLVETMNNRNILKIISCLLIVLGCSSMVAYGQSEVKKNEPLSKKSTRVLRDRNREEMHSELPIKLIGLEEGDNSFRNRTPILEQSDRVFTTVDSDENYRRKLAMYETGQSFSYPLPIAGSMVSVLNTGSQTTQEKNSLLKGKGGEDIPGWGVWRWLLLLTLIALFVGFIMSKRRAVA